jgi:hypothetical protein
MTSGHHTRLRNGGVMDNATGPSVDSSNAGRTLYATIDHNFQQQRQQQHQANKTGGGLLLHSANCPLKVKNTIFLSFVCFLPWTCLPSNMREKILVCSCILQLSKQNIWRSSAAQERKSATARWLVVAVVSHQT